MMLLMRFLDVVVGRWKGGGSEAGDVASFKQRRGPVQTKVPIDRSVDAVFVFAVLYC